MTVGKICVTVLRKSGPLAISPSVGCYRLHSPSPSTFYSARITKRRDSMSFERALLSRESTFQSGDSLADISNCRRRHSTVPSLLCGWS